MIAPMLDASLQPLLRDDEAEFFRDAGAYSTEAVYAFLDASPSLEPGGRAAALGIRRTELLRLLEPALSPTFRDLVAAMRTTRIRGGAAAPLSALTATGAYASTDPSALLPAPTNLPRVAFTKADTEGWSPIDQGDAPICVPDATAACIERMRTTAGLGRYVRLSARFLYERSGGYPTAAPADGVQQGYRKLSQARDALARDGICAETTWRDSGALSELPTGPAITEGKANLIACNGYGEPTLGAGRPAGTAGSIHAALVRDGAVAIAMPAYGDPADLSKQTNWKNAFTERTGAVLNPNPRVQVPVPLSGHAVCLVGYEPDGPGYFVFRNSWGDQFAFGAPLDEATRQRPSPARGFGTITAWHVENFVWEWLSLKRP